MDEELSLAGIGYGLGAIQEFGLACRRSAAVKAKASQHPRELVGRRMSGFLLLWSQCSFGRGSCGRFEDCKALLNLGQKARPKAIERSSELGALWDNGLSGGIHNAVESVPAQCAGNLCMQSEGIERFEQNAIDTKVGEAALV